MEVGVTCRRKGKHVWQMIDSQELHHETADRLNYQINYNKGDIIATNLV